MSARSLRSSALKRLVEQQQVRREDQRAGQRHALLLAARELARQAVGERAELHQPERVAHLPVDLRLRGAADLEREGDVARHGEMREQRIALEHHAEVALLRRQVLDRLAVQQDAAAGRRDEARDRHQHGGLARAGGPEQRQELAARDVDRHLVERPRRAIVLGDPVERQFLQPDHQFFRFTIRQPRRPSCDDRAKVAISRRRPSRRGSLSRRAGSVKRLSSSLRSSTGMAAAALPWRHCAKALSASASLRRMLLVSVTGLPT
jgi:hypothetical protein